MAAPRLCAAALVLLTIGCAPPPAGRVASGDGLALESICARSLQQLDDLIETRATQGGIAEEVMIEVRALRAAAVDLYLDGDHDLALEFIEQAFSLLGTRK